MNFYVPTDEIGRLARGSIQERATTLSNAAVAHLNEIDAKIKVASTVGTFDDRVIVLTEQGEAISIPYEVAGAGWFFGLPERIDVQRYTDADKDIWVMDEALKLADLVLDKSRGEEARNRLRGLAESIAPGGAYTTEAILRRLSTGLSSRSTWADVYAEKAREIRAAIHGQIGRIQESLPKERFRVLATEHAPEDPERFRVKLVGSLELVLKAYEEIAGRMTGLDPLDAQGLSRFIGLAESALLQNLSGFTESLKDSASRVTKDGRQILVIESTSGDIPRLARLHDLLADGLEDFSVCATFVEQLLGSLRQSSTGGSQS